MSRVYRAFLVYFFLMGFKENLKAELAFSGMLVKELSGLTGIKQNTINNYLNVKKRIPSAENAVKIARVLGVSVEKLVTGDEAESAQNPVPGAERSIGLCQEARAAARIVNELDENSRKIVLTMIQALRAADRRESFQSRKSPPLH